MTEGLVLALAQLNPVMGDLAGNVAKLRQHRQRAAAEGAHLLMVPELYVCGYPPEDLALKPSFQKAVHQMVEQLAQDTADGGPAILLTAPWVEDKQLYNACLLLDQGRIVDRVFKRDLPDYGPFDDKRTFTPGPMPKVMEFRDTKLGVLICEDLWTPEVAAALKKNGARILLSPNGSPFEDSKQAVREAAVKARVAETGLPFVYLNQIGGQDEVVYDGASFVLDGNGECVAQLKEFTEDFIIVKPFVTTAVVSLSTTLPEEKTYNALMLGLRDYVIKNGFTDALLGLSGGIDSALVAALAVDALGADKVSGIMMPSPYTSPDSFDDAAAVAHNLKCRYDTISISDAMQSFDKTLAKAFTGKAADLTEENIQARCRGIILMALSNKLGGIVLATGNKSEMAVGYSTLYGDLCGGFAPLKDVYKTEVYKLTAWRNAHKPVMALGPTGEIIPQRVMTKAPTAELRHNQKDQDSLPPYDVLDAILYALIEKDKSPSEIAGHDAAVVKKVAAMLDRAEYKRRQAPPGVKVTRRMLGKDRRYPITNCYRES